MENLDITPTMSHDEYMRRHAGASWDDYWRECYQPLYKEAIWEIFKKNNTLMYMLNDLFSKLEYDKILRHIRENWGGLGGWARSEDDLKQTIIELLLHAVDQNGNIINKCGWSTGGFQVDVSFDNTTPLSITVTFGDFEIGGECTFTQIVEKKISTINPLRRKKLLNLRSI